MEHPNDQPNQVSYNPHHQKIFQEDDYIAYFVLFQIILIYVQVLLSNPHCTMLLPCQ